MKKEKMKGSFVTEGADMKTPQRKSFESLDIPTGSQITFHMFHVNHLDLTWFWRIPDAIEMCLETIRWHTELLEKHPDARYSHAQKFILRIVEQIDPSLLNASVYFLGTIGICLSLD